MNQVLGKIANFKSLNENFTINIKIRILNKYLNNWILKLGFD